MVSMVGWLSGRTSVSDRRTFPGLHRTCSWWVTIYMGKPSVVGQPTRPTQPFILTGWCGKTGSLSICDCATTINATVSYSNNHQRTEVVLVLCPHFFSARNVTFGEIFLNQCQCKQALTVANAHSVQCKRAIRAQTVTVYHFTILLFLLLQSHTTTNSFYAPHETHSMVPIPWQPGKLVRESLKKSSL